MLPLQPALVLSLLTHPAGAQDPFADTIDLGAVSVVRSHDSEVSLLGAAISAGPDLDGDGAADLVVGAPGNASATRSTAWLLYGPVSGRAEIDTDGVAIEAADDREYLGYAVLLSDLGEGPDLVLGAPGAGAVGAVYAHTGDLQDDVRTSDLDLEILGDTDGGRFGHAVDMALDASGVVWLAVGEPGALDGSREGGRVLLFEDPRSGTMTAEDARCELLAPEGEVRFGHALSWGADLDGDGLGELVVGSAQDRAPGLDQAGFHVYASAELAEPVSDTLPVALFVGGSLMESESLAIVAPGDLDGDEVDDLIMGFPDDGNDGNAPSPTVVVYSGADYQEAKLSLFGLDGQTLATREALAGGLSLAWGDVEGDGGTDLLVGMPTMGDAQGSAASLLVDVSAGTHHPSEVEPRWVVDASERSASFVVALVDMLGDGRDDVVVGAPDGDPSTSRVDTPFLRFDESAAEADTDTDTDTDADTDTDVSSDDEDEDDERRTCEFRGSGVVFTLVLLPFLGARRSRGRRRNAPS